MDVVTRNLLEKHDPSMPDSQREYIVRGTELASAIFSLAGSISMVILIIFSYIF